MPRKQKQKQKQTQKQSVVVNIHEKKAVRKRRPRKKKEPTEPLPPPVVLGLPKVPPIVVQYTEPASLTAPPPPAPRQEPARAPAILEAPVQPPIMSAQEPQRPFAEERKRPARAMSAEAALGRERERIQKMPEEQRTPLRAEPIEPQRLFASDVRPASDILQVEPNISFEDVVAGGARISRLPTGIGRAQTQAARETRTALQLSQRAGAEVPLSSLFEGRYNLPGQPRRPQPTVNQRIRMYEAGRPYRGDEEGVKSSTKKKSEK